MADQPLRPAGGSADQGSGGRSVSHPDALTIPPDAQFEPPDPNMSGARPATPDRAGAGGAPEPETLAPPGNPATLSFADQANDVVEGAEVLHSETDFNNLPARFGRYRLQRILGEGGMGVVYLAHDTQLDRQVALKMPRFGRNERGLRDRFFREARAAATLRHPNLCPVFDIGEHDGIHYLTMAYIDGESLSDYLRQHTPFPLQEAVELIAQLARALQEAHEHGIIHRDLKPGNIIMNRKGQPIITDFGLARREAGQDERLTQTGAAFGTPAYMPPEQVNGEVAAMGPGSDVYSLGIILYELLTNRRPFEGALGVLMAQIVMDPPPPPSLFRPDVDRDLEAICLKALAKKPQDRYPSMRAFAVALESWLDDRGQTSGQRRGAGVKPRKKRTALWIGLAATVILLFCVLPIGWVVVVATRFAGKMSEEVNQFGKRIEEQQKEQKQLHEERTKQKETVEQALRAWKAPPADAGPEQLFPKTVAEYRLTESDTKAEIADLKVTGPGHRALYADATGKVELFAYRANNLEKESILRHAHESVTRRGGFRGPGMPAGPSVMGTPEEDYLIYDLGPQAPTTWKHGTFVWRPTWLLLVRGATAHEPVRFVKEYFGRDSE